MCLDLMGVGEVSHNSEAEQDSIKVSDFIPSACKIPAGADTELHLAEPHHSQEQKASPGSSPAPGPLTCFTQVIHVCCRKMPHHSLLDTSTSPLLSRYRGTMWARGSVPGWDAVEAWPHCYSSRASTLLRAWGCLLRFVQTPVHSSLH